MVQSKLLTYSKLFANSVQEKLSKNGSISDTFNFSTEILSELI